MTKIACLSPAQLPHWPTWIAWLSCKTILTMPTSEANNFCRVMHPSTKRITFQKAYFFIAQVPDYIISYSCRPLRRFEGWSKLCTSNNFSHFFFLKPKCFGKSFWWLCINLEIVWNTYLYQKLEFQTMKYLRPAPHKNHMCTVWTLWHCTDL